MKELEQFLKRYIDFGLVTDADQQMISRNLLEIEIHWHPKTRYIEYLDEFNKITGKKYKPDVESRELYYENDALYSNSDRLTALKNLISNPYYEDKNTMVTPHFALQAKIIGNYINYVAPKPDRKLNTDISKINYDEPTVL